jgi:putative intracellular protease/amidase
MLFNFAKTDTMTMKYKIFIVLLVLIITLVMALSPVREFYRIPVYRGESFISYSLPEYDTGKKTILLVAHNRGTEIFDLMAPFYLFHLTNKANVFIVAEKKYPVAVMKGFFVMPHFTFTEIDSLKIKPTVVVIPKLSGMERKNQDKNLLSWIVKRHSDSVRLLSVCAGSVTAAATGLYDGTEMTTHASEIKENRRQFQNNRWLTNVSFTRKGNLYSTAGVSNAVEGSLAVIRDLFGEEETDTIMRRIHYPSTSIKKEHQSIPVELTDKIAILKKVIVSPDPKIGVLLQDGIDEFALSAILDAYHRTFPASLKTYTIHQPWITSRFGLTIIPGGDFSEIGQLDELHVLAPDSVRGTDQVVKKLSLVKYDLEQKEYIFDVCLKRIKLEYGPGLQKGVKRLLDYN